MTNTIRRVGLLSDSHGQAERTHRATQILVEAGAELLIHLGDINSTTVLDALTCGLDGEGQLRPPVEIVLGNTDWNSAELLTHARHLGMGAREREGEVTLGDRIAVFQHGHHDREMHEALERGVDYLFHGHTHVPRDERVGKTRIINPGALQRAREYTVALLDVSSDELQTFTIEKG